MKTGRASLQKGRAGSSCSGTSCFAKALSNTACPAASTETQPSSRTTRVLAKPFIQMLLYEGIILQMRIRLAHAVDFFYLSRREFLMRIKTPASFEQTLAPQNLVNAGNASVKLVYGIEDRRVRVGNLLGKGELLAGDRAGTFFHQGEVGNRCLRPYRPMPQ